MLYYDLKPDILLPQSPPLHGHAALTEKILALNDAAVLLTIGKNAVVHCSESIRTILGIAASDVMEKGWQLLFERIHPCDQKLLSKKLLPDLRRFLRHASASDRHKLAFNYTFRIRHASNGYMFAALENQVVQPKKRTSADLRMSVLKNITPFADRSKIVLKVSRKGSDTVWTTVLEKDYCIQAEGFSPRETQIIHCIAHGLSSKEIGEKLFISPETVRSHRKRIMQRSGCASSAELVAFALRQEIV